MLAPRPFGVLRVLFAPLAGPGYVYPAIRIAKELKKRDWRVGFATGSKFRRTIEEAGLVYLPSNNAQRANVPPQSFQVKSWADSSGIRNQISHVNAACDEFLPHILIPSALCIGPLAVAAARSLATTVLGMGTYPWPITNGRPADNPLTVQDRADQHAQVLFDGMKDLYGEACVEAGAARPSGFEPEDSPLLGDAFLLRSVPDLQPPDAGFPDPVVFVGDCSWEPEQDREVDSTIERFLDRSARMIYVQHDARWTMPYLSDGVTKQGIEDFLPRLIRQARARSIRLFVATNDRRRLSASDQPSSGVLYRPMVSYQQVLPRVDAVIGNGSSSVMTAALTHGRPMAFFSNGSESNFVAARCQEAGVGRGLRCVDVDDHVMQSVLDELLESDDLRQRARHVMRVFANLNGPKIAADRIEQLVSRR